MDRICLPPACAARYAEAHRFVLLDQRPRAAPLTEAAVVFGRESEGGHEDDKPTNERTKVVNANAVIVTTFGRMQRIVIETRGKAQSCGSGC